MARFFLVLFFPSSRLSSACRRLQGIFPAGATVCGHYILAIRSLLRLFIALFPFLPFFFEQVRLVRFFVSFVFNPAGVGRRRGDCPSSPFSPVSLLIGAAPLFFLSSTRKTRKATLPTSSRCSSCSRAPSTAQDASRSGSLERETERMGVSREKERENGAGRAKTGRREMGVGRAGW